MPRPKVHIYLASSIDGFIAGPGDDLSWLPGDEEFVEPETAPGQEAGSPALTYEAFIATVGALLMGRRTYDVVRGFDVDWPYGEKPVLVATRRPLDAAPPASVRPVQGSIEELVDMARRAADGGNVYLDGGELIRQAAAADLIDDLTITLAPVALGAGIPLFAGLPKRYPLEIVSYHPHPGGMLQVRARPRRKD
ncbi:MAG: dihydrofolate reductase family protein [Longimicrobiales bacterium]